MAEFPQVRISKLRISAFIILTCLSLVIFTLFFYSLRRGIHWNSNDLKHQVNIMAGELAIAWRPADWQRENDQHSGVSGLSIAEFDSEPRMIWWQQYLSGKFFNGVSIPLWMPFVFTFIPAAFLGYGMRRSMALRWAQVLGWLRPWHPLKWTVWRALIFMMIHVLVLIPFGLLTQIFVDFFFPWRTGQPVIMEILSKYFFSPLFLLAPLWGALWALLYVRFRNRLFYRRNTNHCKSCGYDLRGNTTGKCPECGVGFVDAQPLPMIV